MESHAVLIAEIADLKARLSEAEAENAALKGDLSKRPSWLEWKEKALAELTKREEAERANRELRECVEMALSLALTWLCDFKEYGLKRDTDIPKKYQKALSILHSQEKQSPKEKS